MLGHLKGIIFSFQFKNSLRIFSAEQIARDWFAVLMRDGEGQVENSICPDSLSREQNSPVLFALHPIRLWL